ncbi:MAG: ribosome-associated translation inhibitor RaiA [Candidatus Aureabacteria bacterium]|nr:ribosome-associated translation inhibitor RaiA [Candidatus Auribacterota bacterium]
MNITVTGRHVSVTESMREYAKEKIQKLEKFAPGLIIDAHVIMDVEKYRQNVEVTLKGKTFTIHAKEETGDMYSSIDILISKLEKKLRSIKEKLQNHHKKSTKEAETILHVLPQSKKKDSAGETTITVKSEKLDGKPLFLEDAILKLQESHSSFLVFVNAETNRVNVIHKITESEIGVIETP